MVWYIAVAVIFVIKFFVYAYYAGILNKWFEKSHNTYQVSGFRLLISFVFMGLNVLLSSTIWMHSANIGQFTSVITALIFALLAWYIVLRIFYTKEHSPILYKALGIGAIISILFAILTGFLSFIGLLSNVNFC
jgi:hypothetical protein